MFQKTREASEAWSLYKFDEAQSKMEEIFNEKLAFYGPHAPQLQPDLYSLSIIYHTIGTLSSVLLLKSFFFFFFHLLIFVL